MNSLENSLHFDAATLRNNVAFVLLHRVMADVKGEVYTNEWFNNWDHVRRQSQIILDSVHLEVEVQTHKHEDNKQKKQKQKKGKGIQVSSRT